MSSNYSVTLLGPAPWGFRLQGGKDFNMPLTISRLTDGGKAAKAGMAVGDMVLSIDGITTDGMNHLEAQNKIKSCADNLSLTLQKASSVPKPPPVAPKTAASARVTNGPQSILKKPQPPRVPRRHVVDTDIHFYHVPTHADASRKRIMEDTEDWRPRTGTTQSRSFKILAQITGTEHAQDEEADKAKKTNSFTLSSSSSLTDSDTNSGKVSVLPAQTVGVYSSCGSSSVPAQNQVPGASSDQVPVHRPCTADGTRTAQPSFQLLTAESSSNVTPLEGSTASEKFESMNCLTGRGDDNHKLDNPAAESLRAALSQFQLSPQHSFPVQVNSHLSHITARHHVFYSTKPVRRELLSSPLDFLPRAAPSPHPLTPSALKQPVRQTCTECYSPVQARTTYQSNPRPSEKAVSQSLLDALLITPVIQAAPLCLKKKKKHRSISELHLPKSKRVSWHQSATEQGDPFFSSPVNAVYVFSEESEEPELNSHESAVVKTMIKGPAATQGHGPRSGLITPSFGMKGNGSASVPRGPVPTRPVPQAHPKDEDTLVQMAEHIPAGTRTPMCANCNMVIRGPFLVAMGKSWHKEEFNCAHCRTSLADVGFVEEQGCVYCEHCYEEFFAPTCSRCQAKILGEVINALKQTWHVYCFLCACCQQPIRNNTFHLEDGEPYCERDFYSLFGTSCHGCEFPIEAGDKFLEALGYTWHDTCFVCAVCCTTLEGHTFFSKKDKPLCKKHAHTLKI